MEKGNRKTACTVKELLSVFNLWKIGFDFIIAGEVMKMAVRDFDGKGNKSVTTRNESSRWKKERGKRRTL
jgi:hypothetical protein